MRKSKIKIMELAGKGQSQEIDLQEVLAKERDHLCAVTMDKWRAAGAVDVTTIKDVFSGYYVYEWVRRSMYFIFPDGKLMSCSRANPGGVELCRPTGRLNHSRHTTLSGKLYDTKEPVIKIVAYAFCQSTRRNADDSIKVRFTEPQGGPESPLKERASNVFFWHKPSCQHCGQNLPKEPGPQTFKRVEHGKNR